MLSIRKVSEVLGKQVFTDTGEFLGQLEGVNIVDNKIDGWRIKVGGQVSSIIGGARGIIVPHQYVKAVGDVFIISKASLPMRADFGEESGAELAEE